MKLILMLVLLIPSHLFSQEEEGVYGWVMQDSTEHYVFGDTVFVRSASSIFSNVIDTLFVGHEVLLVNKTGQHFNLKGISAPWVNITYKKNGFSRKGVMWSGLLSFTPMRRAAKKFVFGFERRYSKDTIIDKTNQVLSKYLVVLKVIETGSLIAKTSFLLNDDDSFAYFSGEVHPGGGLEGIQHIIYLKFGGEACGIPFYKYPFAFTGKNLVPMPLLTDISDAGVFYHSEEFVLPSQKGGIKNTIIINIETGESTETLDKKGDLIFKTSKEQHFYNWDGNAFKFLRKHIKTN